MKTAVLGAGAWGTALAGALAGNGMDTTLWARNPEVVRAIRETGEIPNCSPACRCLTRFGWNPTRK